MCFKSSDSPYLHVFDGLEQVHHQIGEQVLEAARKGIGYQKIKALEHLLPNSKKTSVKSMVIRLKKVLTVPLLHRF